MEPLRVLVVDDEVRLTKIIASYLENDGYAVALEHDGPSAIDRAVTFRPDVVVLDVMLPGLDGMKVCAALRDVSDCYVIMLTARDAESDKVHALSLGADDYVVKPFSPRELLARITAMLRRPRLNALRDGARTICVGGLTIDTETHTVLVDDVELELTPTEFEIIRVLASRPQTAFTRRQIIEAVWGAGWVGDDHFLDVHIGNVRRKLGDRASEPRFIRTVRGHGYAMSSG